MNSISLSELTDSIELAINKSFNSNVWLHAEINELRENNGHCYLELIEKESNNDNIIAKIRATCWASTYRMLKPYFESSTGEQFRAGLNVLIAVSVEFSGIYGMSLNIKDVDPVFTVGELAARRMQIIKQLEADGVAEMNKQLPFPTLPQRLAIISSPIAAGFGDFVDQLKSNSSNLIFYPKLFPAIMQGMQAEESIIRALEKIYEHSELFDVVIIIRGGGAATDLSCFDSYNLALNCAQFPLPIVAGIGHQRDITILDRVAHTSVKTPTAAAEFIINKLEDTAYQLSEVVSDFHNMISRHILTEQKSLEFIRLRIRQASKTSYLHETNRISNYLFKLKNLVRTNIQHETSRLELLYNKINTHSPAFLSERGYTITTLNGKRISSRTEVQAGDIIKTHLPNGSFSSEVMEDV